MGCAAASATALLIVAAMHQHIAPDHAVFAEFQLASADLAVLDYAFENRSGKTAYLFNKIPAGWKEASMETSPDLAYVAIEAGRAVVAKQIMPVPPLMSVEVREIPAVTAVPPGARFSERIHLPLPLEPRRPYGGADRREARERDVEVVFRLGFFFAPPEGERLAKQIETNIGPALFFGQFPIDRQQVVELGPFATRVTARAPD